jgi:biotin synthase-related radical SAM superfamily protein
MVFVRVSLWGLVGLGLVDGPSISHPLSILYVLQYSRDGCLANCSFCAQSRRNSFVDKRFLSRITWPKIELSRLLNAIRIRGGFIHRICFQTIIKKWFLDEALFIAEKFWRSTGKPLSLAITPIPKRILYRFRDLGVDYLGVGLDAASPRIFRVVGKPYSWDRYLGFIRDGISVFGSRHVYVHLILGLGEKPLETYVLMEKLIGMGADIALFAYTPIDKGLYKPVLDITYYREAQIIRYLLLRGYSLGEIINNNGHVKREIIREIIRDLDKYYEAFLTSGCPYCNRPYYNESPRGPFYNLYSHKHYLEYKNRLIGELRRLLGSD